MLKELGGGGAEKTKAKEMGAIRGVMRRKMRHGKMGDYRSWEALV